MARRYVRRKPRRGSDLLLLALMLGLCTVAMIVAALMLQVR